MLHCYNYIIHRFRITSKLNLMLSVSVQWAFVLKSRQGIIVLYDIAGLGISEIPKNWRYYLPSLPRSLPILTNIIRFVLVAIQISKWNMRFIIQTRLEKEILFFWKCAWSDFHEGMKQHIEGYQKKIWITTYQSYI